MCARNGDLVALERKRQRAAGLADGGVGGLLAQAVTTDEPAPALVRPSARIWGSVGDIVGSV
jgi:hypothetical protein